MKEFPKSAEEWRLLWRANELSWGEFRDGLFYSAKFNTPDEVLTVLRPHELERFERDVRETLDAYVEGEEMIVFGNPPEWAMEDVRRIVAFLDQRKVNADSA